MYACCSGDVCPVPSSVKYVLRDCRQITQGCTSPYWLCWTPGSCSQGQERVRFLTPFLKFHGARVHLFLYLSTPSPVWVPAKVPKTTKGHRSHSYKCSYGSILPCPYEEIPSKQNVAQRCFPQLTSKYFLESNLMR